MNNIFCTDLSSYDHSGQIQDMSRLFVQFMQLWSAHHPVGSFSAAQIV